jgi:hypothetical protein
MGRTNPEQRPWRCLNVLIFAGPNLAYLTTPIFLFYASTNPVTLIRWFG